MKHFKYLVLCAVGLSAAPAVRSQPPDKTQEQALQEDQALREGRQRQWEAEKRERQAKQRRTPSGALWQFAGALEDSDLILAARGVEGGREDADQKKLAAKLQKERRTWRLTVTPLFGEAPPDKAEFEARVGVSLRLNALLADDPLLQLKTTFIERVTMRRGADGEWKIVPRAAPAVPAPPADESAPARAQAIEASTRLGQSEDDGFLNTWARVIAAPRAMLVGSTSRESMQNVKQVLLGIMQLAQDYDETYAFTPENFQEKVMPYVKSEQLFLAPTLDEDTPFAYALNPALAGQKMAALDEVAQTVAVYEADGEGKPLFRFGGKAVVGFADGHVALIGPEQAEKLTWKIEAAPRTSN